MISMLAALGVAFGVGLPISRSIDPGADPLLRAGTSFLYGSGAIFLALLALSMLGIAWSALSVGAALCVLFAAAAILAWRARPGSAAAPPRLHLLDVLTLAALAGYVLYATFAPPYEVDFWAIWGLKARAFFVAGGVDWRFLESRWNAFQHPDYPLLVPLDFAFAALVNGGWDDRWIGLFHAAWGASLVLVVRSLAARALSPLCAALAAFALCAPCFSHSVGLAEAAYLAFSAAAVLFLREALRGEDASAWRHGALLLGFAANCKNEGLALIAAVAVGLAVAGPRTEIVPRLRRLWPALAVAAPWIALRAAHALPTDIASGGAAARLMERLAHAEAILALLAARLNQPESWIALAAALLVVPASALARERFVFVATAIQLGFFIAAYFATPYDVAWHVWTSWPRLTAQLAVPVSFVVLLKLLEVLTAPSGTPTRGSTA